MSKVHVIARIEKFDNFMFCGKKNPSFELDTWVSPYEVTINYVPIEDVTCDACRELYTLEVLGNV